MDCFYEETSKNIDKSRVFSDVDGTFDCTLINYNDDNRIIVDEIQIMIIINSLKYSLLIHKSNDETSIDMSDSNVELVKSRFNVIFHNLTGNFWKHRNKFLQVPGNYYLLSNDLNSSSTSEEQQTMINKISDIPKFVLNERAFINIQTNSIQETYPYTFDGSTWQIILPEISNENEIKSSLLFIRSLIVRIGVVYEYDSSIQMTYGSGCLITNNELLTCAHIFDPILWEKNNVSYSKILVAFCDPAPNKYFSILNPNQIVYSAKIIRRGLSNENIDKFNELKKTHTDLALLRLENQVSNLSKDKYFDPKLNVTSSAIPIDSMLYLAGYNGELRTEEELSPYKYLKDFQNLTIDKLNNHHHVNYKSISIGNLIKEPCQNNPYSFHTCSALSGSNGSIILDCYGKLAGIHIGITNSRKQKDNEIFFTKETYNKFLSINSYQFQTFIHETIVPNITDDEVKKLWVFHFK